MTSEEKDNLIRRLHENGLSKEQLSNPIWHKIEGNKSNKSTECYVYLMKDTANGRYKIGMSKKPEYREKTLQSEKPEITLVCSKKYNSRDEARKTEKELHQRFKSNRIRGEWFNLSVSDVENVRRYLGGSVCGGAAWDTSQKYRFGYIPI
jgi:T5orf172 domain.